MSEQETRLNNGADLEIAHPEDFGIVRDDDGEIQPTKQKIPGTDKAILVTPLVDGAYKRHETVLESTGEADDEEVDALFRERIVKGIGSDGLSGVPDYMVSGLVQAIKDSSGYQVFQEVEQIREKEQMSRIEAMDLDFEEIVQEEMNKRMNNEEGEEETEEESDEVPEALKR